MLEHHAARHRLSGMNSDRLLQWVPSYPRLSFLLTMATTVGKVDMDPEFIPFRHTGPLRPLLQRLLHLCIVFMRIKCGVQGRISCFD